MGTVLVTFRIMPENVDTDLSKLEGGAKAVIEKFGGKVVKVDREPVAFGLEALNISCGLDENNSNLDPLEDQLRNIEGIVNVDVVDVRRAIG